MADGRKNNQIYAVVGRSLGGRVMLPAVDCYIVSSGRQPCSELFCECLKTTIVCRNTSRPQNGYFHTVMFFLFRKYFCTWGPVASCASPCLIGTWGPGALRASPG